MVRWTVLGLKALVHQADAATAAIEHEKRRTIAFEVVLDELLRTSQEPDEEKPWLRG